MVDLRGFEPLTSTLPVWRAPNCAKGPYSEHAIYYHKVFADSRGIFHEKFFRNGILCWTFVGYGMVKIVQSNKERKPRR